MNRDPILFRVDATPRTGWERINRCLAYAAALQRRRRPAFFLSQLEPAHFALGIKRAGNEWLEADAPAGTEEDVTETVQEIRRIKPAAVVVDTADVNENYLSELCATGILVVSIDHQARIRFPSQVVINPLLGLGRERYEFVPGTQLLLGRRYAIVRPSIRRIRQVRSQEPPTPFRAFVALADDDFEGLTQSILKMLLPVSRLEKIDIAVRPDAPALEDLKIIAEEHHERVELISEPHELPLRIARSHFAITRGDAWSLELACVGVPQLIVVHSDNHTPTARKLEDEGAAVCIGEFAALNAGQLRQAINDLLSDPFERQMMARCGRKLIDGRGPDRLVTALEVMLHPSRLAELHEAA